MYLPDPVRAEVSAALGRIGTAGSIVSVSALSGGCINNGVRLDTDNDRSYFLKWNASAPPDMFAAETDGLRALHEAAATVSAEDRPRIPRALARSDQGDGPDWLLMEWIPPAPRATDSEERLGRGLATIHGSTGSKLFGWHADNWIGSLPQRNGDHPSWSDFWRDRRIVPQLEAARERGHLTGPRMDELVDGIPRALDGTGPPELLHGDLWSGNTFTTESGTPVLIDPAVYRGDGEVDLAMSELFGGFGSRFYDAYADVRPISPEYESHRRDLYQLYFLLVHVNLFGAGYVASSLRAATNVLAALG